MRKNKKEIPAEFVTVTKNSIPGSYMFGCQDDKTLVSMITKKKKVVLVVMSTMHDDDTVDPDSKKPSQISDYNRTKGGVDTVDLMCSRISTSRRTKRWPMVIFFRLLDLAGINSLRIFQFNMKDFKNTRRAYLYELALELMTDNLKERAKIPTLTKYLSVFLEKYKEEPAPVRVPQEVRRGICYICGSKKNNRTKLECHNCRKNVCKNHSSISTTCQNCQNAR